MTSLTYPSGRAVQQGYDALGRLNAISSGATTYANLFTYNPAQQVTGFNYGNGIAATFGYSPARLQLDTLSYRQGTTDLFRLTYGYTQSGGNNGQVTSIVGST